MGRKFKPGESGNPLGHARKKSLTDMIRLVAHEEVKALDADGKNPRTVKRLRLVAEALVNKAAEGDVAAIRETLDRLDGKVKEVVKHEGDVMGAMWEAIQGNTRVRPDDDSDDRPTTH